MTLESTPEEFAARFAAFAAQGVVYPQPEGSPLLEFTAGGRVLYLFDRSGPYAARPGPARVVVHGVARRWALSDAREEALGAVGVSAVEGVGVVLSVARQVLVVQARLPLVLGVLGGAAGVSVGDWVAFETEPPLHGFLAEGVPARGTPGG
ncbi:hypothetical protein [Deinococcus maricopensis]|uniref:Uncharacterized protein n=1 Tax=Deinococcus maricopensis (strain DSM 21211 / LMG 22137 / NRRL B-23946 / LB-34) TaxID=709986 RepID=E8U5A8_DEIML|nr:hypothetical protein [Deinococcus maricopensis]ADV66247.1 hypothetical protein Deima_0588 [Deinococcus maricopensis DSM 21211]